LSASHTILLKRTQLKDLGQLSQSPSPQPEEAGSPNEPDQNLAFRFGSVCLGAMLQVAVGVALGYWLDQKLGTIFLTLVGLGLGMLLATVSLIRFAQKWTPVARRSAKELSDEDGKATGEGTNDDNQD
jgi:F0F1-type ATP synthase assembly protein I